jgi:phosphoserine phosphatase
MTASFMEFSEKMWTSLSRKTICTEETDVWCVDMDLQTEVIDELADRAGVGEQVRTITESAMNGEIDFSENFKQRMALLEGLVKTC